MAPRHETEKVKRNDQIWTITWLGWNTQVFSASDFCYSTNFPFWATHPSTFLLFFTLIWFSNTETLSPFLCTSQSLPVLNLVQSSGVLATENRSNIRVGKVWEVQWKCESVFCVVLAQLAVRKYWALCWLVDTLLLIWSVVHNVICFWECFSWFQWRSRCRKTTCACVLLCQSWTWSAYCVIITMEVREAHFSLCSFFNPVNRKFSNAEKS